MPFRQSIAAKLIAIVVGVVLLTLTAATIGSLHREVGRFNDFQKEELLATAQILSSSVATPLATEDITAVRATLTSIGRLENILLVQVQNATDDAVAEMGQAVILPLAIKQRKSLVMRSQLLWKGLTLSLLRLAWVVVPVLVRHRSLQK